ncbi:MAG TPA: riboflavin synthase [Acidimicrobiales bacterium]|nr:riboflavin synthase [Acidimicrobiales bacterium]
MFTGLVEEMGTVVAHQGARLRIVASPGLLEGAAVGDSMALDGCCLTVVALGDEVDGSRWWEADVSAETASRTTLGELAPGQRVNLERPVRLTDRLGGHLVQGHVDGVGEVLRAAPELRVRVPAALGRFMVEKGSVTVDGVSLTVVDATTEAFAVAVIPHTASATTLGFKAPGTRVNVEVDIVAKYVERLLRASGASTGVQR